MDHLKGSRKADGRSRAADLRSPREETYWTAQASRIGLAGNDPERAGIRT
jgi:hypothetical protein